MFNDLQKIKISLIISIYSLQKNNKSPMYFDLSVLSTNLLDLSHLLRSLPGNSIGAVAIDYQCSDCAIPPLPDSFNKLKVIKKQLSNRILKYVYTVAQQYPYNKLPLYISWRKIPHIHTIQSRFAQKTKRSFTLCAQNMKQIPLIQNYDVISLDCRVKLPFMLKRNPVYQALRKGKYFQLQYAPIFQDANRVVCMTNFINVIKATNSKNLIITSHSDHWRTHRSPYDVAALLSSLGMGKELALTSMKENAEQVLRSGAHRIFFKGTIREISEVTVKKLGKRIRKHKEGINKIAKSLSIPL